MKQQIATLAFEGDWTQLLPLLRANPDLVNSPSETKGYSPLHQAAWHGAPRPVIGELLALGANRQKLTSSARQTPQDIAAAKHPKRDDLRYLLLPQRRTLGQLLRKIAVAEGLFRPYDGNQTILDQLVSIFISEPCPADEKDAEKRIASGFFAVTGKTLEAEQCKEFVHDFGVEHFALHANFPFWRNQLLPTLTSLVPQADVIPLEPDWSTVADLFDPTPKRWGLRGDLFLWIEMRHALCHVALPETPEALLDILSKTFGGLTGNDLTKAGEFLVKRFARGGMSGGVVSSDFWRQDFIPTLQLRLQWLRESWSWNVRS